MSLGARLNDVLPNPFFGNANAGPLASQATLTRGQLAAPVSAVPERQRTARARRQEQLQRRRHRMEQADDARLGRTRQLHLQCPEGQPDWRRQLLLADQPRAAAEQLQLHPGLGPTTTRMRTTATASSTSRTA
jgi:hypothetical protein